MVHLSLDTGPFIATCLPFRNPCGCHTVYGSLARARPLPCCQSNFYYLWLAVVGSESTMQRVPGSKQEPLPSHLQSWPLPHIPSFPFAHFCLQWTAPLPFAAGISQFCLRPSSSKKPKNFQSNNWVPPFFNPYGNNIWIYVSSPWLYSPGLP